jgi:hypothetical protein
MSETTEGGRLNVGCHTKIMDFKDIPRKPHWAIIQNLPIREYNGFDNEPQRIMYPIYKAYTKKEEWEDAIRRLTFSSVEFIAIEVAGIYDTEIHIKKLPYGITDYGV